MHKICAYIDDKMVLHLFPRNPLEEMGLKYLGKELVTHGMSLISIEDIDSYKALMEKEHAEK